MVSTPSPSTTLDPIGSEPRPLAEWLTTFHLASVVLDPYTNESSWILDTAARVLRGFAGAAVRVNFVVTASDDEAKAFLGPLAKEFLVFADPDRAFVRSLGLTSLPAFVFVRSDGTVPAAAEGWDAMQWRAVAKSIADTTSWSVPSIPAPGDPVSFHGTPAVA
ncbi:MAG: redoxin family protein [Actinomycetota bacterium]|nr:redoxin family protein [Actinomycetota bacterium]MDA2970797.1 redoxin family protein [Actinomycetota bacterium]MDA3001132.1 redoxin family protein [Actinomycetota bacterium]